MEHSARAKNTSRRRLPPQREYQENQNRRTGQRHEQSYSQAARIFGNHSDGLGACRSSERCERKKNAASFFLPCSIPPREPGNESGVDTRAAESEQENRQDGHR